MTTYSFSRNRSGREYLRDGKPVVESNPIEEKSVECVMCGERTHFKCDKAGWDVIWQMYQHAAYYCTDCFDEAKAEGVV